MFVPVVVLALAAAPAGPLAVVKSADAEVQKVLQADSPTTEKLAAKADEYIDFLELARRALGKEWSNLNKKQQDEFSATMKGVLRASYAQKAITDGRGTAKVEYGEEKIEGNEATVQTTLVVKEDRFPVVYKLFRADAKAAWKIFDVVTDDVSLVATYNDQFRQVIGKKGFDGLLKSLKAKKEQLEKTTTAQSAARP
ncbi:MAG: ABC transporter substrate-binding protein [Myxococcota bacterium]